MNSVEKIVKVFRGTVIHSIELNSIQILKDSVLGVNESGRIGFFKSSVGQDEFTQIKSSWDIKDSQVVEMGEKRFLIPGFIDTHAHAPQYHNAGTGTDLPLLKWLEKYTFPTESKFRDIDFAKNVYSKVVNRMIKNGTTTCCYYATIHLPASLLLAQIVSNAGQRAFIGKVCMDRHSPDHYIEDSQQSLDDTRSFVDTILSTGNELVKPIITPRFAPSCTNQLMTGLGKLAREKNTLIQSHISENTDEVLWVKELYPEHESYTDVYKHFDMLNERTIMAHAIHLSEKELSSFKECKAGISHCPVSNFTLASGAMNVRDVLDNDIKLGLGTDVSGGYSASMLSVIRDTVKCSAAIYFHRDLNHKPVSFEEAFYLATVGGSKVVGLEDKIGNFVVGKDFDAQIIDPSVENGPFDIFTDDSPKDIFQKFIFLGDDRNVANVYVKGRQVL
eukprot:gene11491-13403_t